MPWLQSREGVYRIPLESVCQIPSFRSSISPLGVVRNPLLCGSNPVVIIGLYIKDENATPDDLSSWLVSNEPEWVYE
jgi:hypothetical protein